MVDRPDTRTAQPRAIDWDALPFGGDLFGELYLSNQEDAATRQALPRTRYLPGLQYSARDLRLALNEASDGWAASMKERSFVTV